MSRKPDYFRVSRLKGWGQKEERYLRVTARRFEFWKRATQTGSYELHRINEIKQTRPEKIRIMMDTLYPKEKKIDILFANESDARNFKDTLTLNQDKDRRRRDVLAENLRALRSKYNSLSPEERSILNDVEGEKVGRREALKNFEAKKTFLKPKKDRINRRSYFEDKSSLPSPYWNFRPSHKTTVSDKVFFPELKRGDLQIRELKAFDHGLSISFNKLYFPKHNEVDAMVHMSLLSDEGEVKSTVNQTPQLRFGTLDTEREWDADDCTFESWDCGLQCGDVLKLSLLIAYKPNEKPTEIGSGLYVLGSDIENEKESNLWLQFDNAKKKNTVAEIQVKIRFRTSELGTLTHVLSNEFRWGLQVGERKEEKLINKTPKLVVTFIGAMRMPEKNLLHLWLEDKDGHRKSHIEKTEVHDPKDHFGTKNVFKHWGVPFELGDQLCIKLVKRKKMPGYKSKFRELLKLKEDVDFKTGYSTSFYLPFDHMTKNILYLTRVLINIKYVR